jgi:diguanylate cyclase (GGDEF)-like protein
MGPSPPLKAALLDQSKILAALPLAAVVFDAGGTILYANDRAMRLLDPDAVSVPVTELLGKNVLDLVHPDDKPYAVDLLQFSVGLPSQVLGPVRLRYLTSAGRARYTDVWVQQQTDNPELGGYVALLTEETTQHRLATAVSEIAEGEPLRTIFESVALAVEGFPLEGVGAVLHRDRTGRVTRMTSSDLPSALTGGAPGPWDLTLDSGQDVDYDDLLNAAEALAIPARGAGMQSVWCRAVPTTGPEQFALVVWRDQTGPPRPNQAVHLHQAVGVLRMALAHKRQRQELRTMAYTDPLTGLSNRAHLYDIRGADLEGTAVLFVDLDGFKQVNDRWGHEAGDDLLKRVASVLRGTTRHNDEVIRLGGDEFVIICQTPNRPDELSALAERIIQQVAEPVHVRGQELSIGASVGIVHFDDHADLDALLRDADDALYLAKAKGRGRWWMAPRE